MNSDRVTDVVACCGVLVPLTPIVDVINVYLNFALVTASLAWFVYKALKELRGGGKG